MAWILKQLLEAGRRSCRLATLTAVQLAGCLAAHPGAGLPHAAALEALCLYGFADEAAALNGADDVVTDPEALADLAALLRPLDESLGAAWAGSDVAPRVAALCLLHCWVRAGEGSPACALWDRLLLLAATDADLASSRYQFKGPTHRRKVRLWQALAVLAPAAAARAARDATAGDLDTVLRILESNNASTVKQYQEVAAVVLLRATQDPLAAVRGSVLQLLGRLRTSKRDDLPSLILIASQCLLLAHADPAVPDAAVLQFAGEVVLAIVPWALSHVHPVRTFSQLALWRLLEAFPQLARDDAGLRAMLAFFSGNADVLRLKAALGLGNDLQAFDPVEATSPAGVLYKVGALACERLMRAGHARTQVSLQYPLLFPGRGAGRSIGRAVHVRGRPATPCGRHCRFPQHREATASARPQITTCTLGFCVEGRCVMFLTTQATSCVHKSAHTLLVPRPSPEMYQFHQQHAPVQSP